MYGIHCDMCGRFIKLEDVENWGKIQKVKISYDECLTPTGEIYHVCPTCLSMITEKFII